MPILTINHVTTYHYRRPVAFGEHRMMLRPRDDDDQKVLESELEITPEPRHLSWTQDVFGNHVATARFAHRASELRTQPVFNRHASAAPAAWRCWRRSAGPRRGELQPSGRPLIVTGGMNSIGSLISASAASQAQSTTSCLASRRARRSCQQRAKPCGWNCDAALGTRSDGAKTGTCRQINRGIGLALEVLEQAIQDGGLLCHFT